MEKSTEEKIQQLQMMEQGMQSFLMQKQQFQTQLVEIDSALQELDKTDKAYKIVGNIMVSADKEKLSKDLKEKKETAELRIKTLEAQEKTTRDKAEGIQKEVLEAMKNDDKNG